MRKISLSLLIILILYGCSSTIPSMSNQAEHTMNTITPSDFHTKSATAMISPNIIPAISPDVKPTNTEFEVQNKDPFFIIGDYILDTAKYTYYLKGRSIYRLTKASGKSQLFDKSSLNITNLLVGKDENLYFLANEIGDPNFSSQLYLHSERGDKVIIPDVDELLFSNEKYLYYVNNLSLYKLNTTSKVSSILNFPENAELSVDFVDPERNTVYYSYSDGLYEYRYNLMNGVCIKSNDNMIHEFTDDNQYFVDEQISFFSDSYSIKDRNRNEVGAFKFFDSMTIDNIVVKNDKAYVFAFSFDKVSISTFNIENGAPLSEYEVYAPELEKGFQCCCKYYNGYWYIYLHDSKTKIYYDGTDVNKFFNVIPRFFIFDFDKCTLTKLWERPSEKFNVDESDPDFTILNNTVWFYKSDPINGRRYEGSYNYWFRVPLESR